MGTGNWERGRRGLGALAVGVGGANGERGPADGRGGLERGRRPSVRRSSSVVRRPIRSASGAGRRRCLSVLLIAISHFLCPHSPHAQTARLAVLADSATAGEPFDVLRDRAAPAGAAGRVPRGGRPGRPRRGCGSATARPSPSGAFPPAVRGSVRVDSAVYRVVTFAADAARVGPVAVTVRGGGETAAVETGTARVPVRSVPPGRGPTVRAGARRAGGPVPECDAALGVVGRARSLRDGGRSVGRFSVRPAPARPSGRGAVPRRARPAGGAWSTRRPTRPRPSNGTSSRSARRSGPTSPTGWRCRRARRRRPRSTTCWPPTPGSRPRRPRPSAARSARRTSSRSPGSAPAPRSSASWGRRRARRSRRWRRE